MLLPFGPDTTNEQVAHEMRNWNLAFLRRAIDRAIENEALSADLHDCVSRVGELRDQRHRMIHDAMEVGIEEGDDGTYKAVLLREGFVRQDKVTTRRVLEYLTPEDVAALAVEPQQVVPIQREVADGWFGF